MFFVQLLRRGHVYVTDSFATGSLDVRKIIHPIFYHSVFLTAEGCSIKTVKGVKACMGKKISTIKM